MTETEHEDNDTPTASDDERQADGRRHSHAAVAVSGT
ncbi:MAG: hypothetical protein QOG94_3549 [Solirubrobacteraceae bacterium]|jgi:hypothetical protein|nr:hypothetical protein [Solirubrobacteraceae bacterium]MEA2139384.1 hypothetical protein [Solirubrobacteraceae bacterium]